MFSSIFAVAGGETSRMFDLSKFLAQPKQRNNDIKNLFHNGLIIIILNFI